MLNIEKNACYKYQEQSSNELIKEGIKLNFNIDY